MGVKGADLAGKRFGHLTAIEKVKFGYSKYKWKCVCDCGKETYVRTGHLIDGNTRSCGCQHYKYGHGKTNTRLYHIWCTMKARCNNTTSSGYYKYGARGIRVCEEWQAFEPFYDWAMANGYADNLSIDRIDNGKGYDPMNCRWTTAKEQANNTRKNKKYIVDGKLYTLYELSQLSGVPQKLICSRICKGWDAKDAAFTEKGSYHAKRFEHREETE